MFCFVLFCYPRNSRSLFQKNKFLGHTFTLYSLSDFKEKCWKFSFYLCLWTISSKSKYLLVLSAHFNENDHWTNIAQWGLMSWLFNIFFNMPKDVRFTSIKSMKITSSPYLAFTCLLGIASCFIWSLYSLVRYCERCLWMIKYCTCESDCWFCCLLPSGALTWWKAWLGAASYPCQSSVTQYLCRRPIPSNYGRFKTYFL